MTQNCYSNFKNCCWSIFYQPPNQRLQQLFLVCCEETNSLNSFGQISLCFRSNWSKTCGFRWVTDDSSLRFLRMRRSHEDKRMEKRREEEQREVFIHCELWIQTEDTHSLHTKHMRGSFYLDLQLSSVKQTNLVWLCFCPPGDEENGRTWMTKVLSWKPGHIPSWLM